MSYNLTISIGRGTASGEYLRGSVWDDFRDDTVAVSDVALIVPGAQCVQYGTVTGVWDGETEESFTITVAGTDPDHVVYGPDEDVTLRALIERLASGLAARYRQECVAVSWYRPDLIPPPQ